MAESRKQVTDLFQQLCEGNQSVSERLFPLVYDRLRSIAAGLLRSERAHHTLQPTALVHEAFLRLVDVEGMDAEHADDALRHFLCLAARAMRRILVEHARHQGRQKRGGEWQRVTLNEAHHLIDSEPRNLLDLEAALERLGRVNPRLLQAAELRLFAGLSVREMAPCLGISLTRAKVVWSSTRVMLAKLLDESTAISD